MADWFKILSVFLACAIAFGKMGMPAALVLFKLNFFKTFIVTVAGGITGNILFTNLSAVILKKWHAYRVKNNNIHKKKIFTPFNRRIMFIKKRFGLFGIAAVTPLFLSTPLGAFLAERFFKDKRKIIIYLSISTIFWSLTFYLIALLFEN
jgi:hypothetical protein